MTKGTLYLVATPIGNLEDITLRALRVLSKVPLIAAEDTRTTRKLLSRHGIAAPRIISYTERNREERTPTLLAALLDRDVALVSEAGTPAISDPGYHLVDAAVQAGVRVVPISGASALTSAVAASGLPSRRFHYLGFLPRKGSERRKLLELAAREPDTLVLFEAPHRLRATLADLLDVLGDRRVAVARELTKLHEEVFRSTLSDAIDHFAAPRGEFTLVVEGAGERPGPGLSGEEVDALLRELKASGKHANEAVREASELTGHPRRELYRRWLAL
jgi:16S rRNA (cytidine1402-2'-O)-methyltransferase